MPAELGMTEVGMIELEKGAPGEEGPVAGPGVSVSSQSAAMPPAAWVGHVSLPLSH